MKNIPVSLLAITILFFLPSDINAQEHLSDYEKMMNERNKVDWPFLNCYREDNNKLGLPSAGEKRVVFMGNSITEGWKYMRPEYFAGKPYICRGISGQTSPQMLVRFRPDVIALKPAVVLILTGINDIAGNTGPSTLEMIADNITSMAELAKANGIQVVLCSVLPAYDFPWNPGVFPAEKIVLLNKWIKEYAATNGFAYLDYYSSMVNERKGLKIEFSEDGVHPNEKGYKVMEQLAEIEIAKALKK
ncbi:MAG: lipolytic protein g-d-s-l [Bacteroidetes bacterium]|jgi:lysophospholipase L1-like esterase|nr:MAG: lipolytic protein g-d-s-l [Bacteroidota bacterium]